MAAIAGIGFLMKVVLIPGQDRWIKYGKNVEIYVLNLDRHQWGTVHLVIALVLLGLLLLHIILHWKLIVGLFSKLITNKSTRKLITVVFVFISVFLFLFAFFVKPEIGKIIQGHGRLVTDENIVSETEIADIHDNKTAVEEDNIIENTEESHERHNRSDRDIEIRGYMTIGEVSLANDVPSSYIKKKLNIPETVSDNQSLGVLRREYGFRMSDIEKIINEYKK